MKDSERFRWQQYLLRHTRLDPNTGCWKWRLLLFNNGYGRANAARNAGMEEGTHRLAYTVFVGPIPEGQLVRHQCHNKTCCNPTHLLVGTNKDNYHDNRRSGLLAGCAKLLPQQVAEIKRLLATGTLTQRELGVMFGVVTTTIGHIKRGKLWANVSPAT